jgi:LmbE family N-acetylglucosaminyl deacetylase
MQNNKEEKKVVMLITAHPDDSEFGAGGTVAKWAKEGRKIIYVVCTNGDKGTSDVNMTSENLAIIREKEQREAARVLGVTDVNFLGYPDGWIEALRISRKTGEMINCTIPDIVITHDPQHRYMGHRDHRVTGMVAMDAVFPYSRDHLFYPEHRAEGLMGHKVGEVYFTGSEEPNTFIDISETFDVKVKALSCHVSQVGEHSQDWDAWVKRMAERAAFAGRSRNLPLAEAFRRIEVRR